MTIKRIAIVFDNSLRPETTGLYCRRALEQFVATEHILPKDLDRTTWSDFDLVVRIDDGLDYELPPAARPVVYWAIDTHLDFARTRHTAKAADLVFTAQRDGAAKFREAGIDSAAWLPLACDPWIHRPHEVPIQWDWCFVGHVLDGARRERLERLQAASPNHFVGQRYFDEMARSYSAAKIVFNHSVRGDINMRVFEALACGGMLLTDDLADNGLAELFQDGTHLATFGDDDELLDRLKFYLREDELRQRIAAAGQAEVLAKHTYDHRMHRLLLAAERRLSHTTHTTAMAAEGEQSETTPDISAVLLSWKRPENIRRIVPELLQENRFREIIIWNNNPEVQLAFDDHRVRVLNRPDGENVGTWGRFLAAREANSEIIYTQDDDCVVGNIRELCETFQADPSRVVYSLKLGHLADVAAALPGGQQGVLLGWGSVFRREWTEAFAAYLERFGEDELLHRKADRLFGPLLHRVHRPVPADVVDLPGASGPEALSVRPDHFALNAAAMQRVAELRGVADAAHSTSPSLSQTRELIPQDDRDESAASLPAKDQAYFEFDRPELLARIPTSARRVLDLGCGAGRLGEQLKSRQPVEVVGIERDPAVAERARERLDRAIAKVRGRWSVKSGNRVPRDNA